jgi:hypothetical protein
MEYGDRGTVVVLQWRGCLSAIEYGDNGAVKILREEANELPAADPATKQKQQEFLPLATSTRKKKQLVAVFVATRSAITSLIYGDPHLPPPPHLRLRPPELHEVEEEDAAVPDPAARMNHLSPSIDAKRH